MALRRRQFLVRSAALGAALLLGAQLVPVERTNPPVQVAVAAPAAVQAILAASCFDCHSHETRWPWYSRVAPLSWWIVGHVNEGRSDLNFSQWPAYDLAGQELALRAMEKQIAADSMPPRSYVLGHPGARLSEEQKQLLLAWVRTGLTSDFEDFR